MLDMLKPENAYIYRITHVRNVPWILDHGLACQSSAERDPDFVEIGKPELIGRRQSRSIKMPPGGILANYIPFYFTTKSPMLLNIKTGYGVAQRPMSEIAVLKASLRVLDASGIKYLISDRHALLEAACFVNDLSGLDLIPWSALRACDFRKDHEDPLPFERYQAEALIFRSLPVSALKAIITSDDMTRLMLQEHVRRRSLSLKVVTLPERFF